MKTALLACILFAPSLAHSAIIFQEIPENEQIFVSGQRAFDFDGNGATDLTFLGQSPNFQMLMVRAEDKGFILKESGIDKGAAVFGSGAIVSATGPYGSTWYQEPTALISQLFDNGNGPVLRGAWAGQSGYLGFSFYHEETRSARFGWLEMEENGGWLRLKRWAYESEDNRPFLAGQIPEPSSLMLLIATSGMIWRRRRDLPEK